MKNVVRRVIVLFAFTFLGSGVTAHAAGVDMKEGEWEISSETSMKMEGMSMPPMASKSTYCLTREDPVPKSEKDNKECRIVKQKVTGNKVSWRMECKKAEGEGEITYRGTSYKGFFKMRTAEDGQTMTMDTKLAGKYLGPCPKGQKSGPTGETAKQMTKGQEMAAKGKQQQEEMAANAKKGEALIKRSVVPAEERGACGQEGFGRTPECEGKIGDLNLKPGEYEVTVERGSRIGTTYTPVEVGRKTECLTEDGPVPGAMGAGRPLHVKRGKEKITWADSTGGRTTKGGILYRGNSFEGAMTSAMDLGGGQKSLSVAKVTGRRIGDGDCAGGRGYSGRAHPVKKEEGGDAAAGENNLLKNPVKGIRNLFGF